MEQLREKGNRAQTHARNERIEILQYTSHTQDNRRQHGHENYKDENDVL